MPIGDVFVCDTRCHIKHDDTALTIDIISVAKTAEFFLASCIPDIEFYGAEVLRMLERQNKGQQEESYWSYTYRCET